MLTMWQHLASDLHWDKEARGGGGGIWRRVGAEVTHFQPQQLSARAGRLTFDCPPRFKRDRVQTWRPGWSYVFVTRASRGCDSSLGRGRSPLTLTVRMTLTYTAKVAEATRGEMAGMLNSSAVFWVSRESVLSYFTDISLSHPLFNDNIPYVEQPWKHQRSASWDNNRVAVVVRAMWDMKNPSSHYQHWNAVLWV